MAGKLEIIRRANALLAEIAPDAGPLKADHFDMIFRAIYETVRADERVAIQHFGTFVRVRRAARRGWSRRKNSPTHIPASIKLMFRSKVRFTEGDA